MDKKLITLILMLVIFVFGGFFIYLNSQNKPKEEPKPQEQESKREPENPVDDIPLLDYKSRVTKKPFGLFVTPANSPVSPERFTGFHNATDFEAKTDELNKEVPIKAICDGDILVKSNVSGYGGLVITSCTINGSAVTVLYGHLDLKITPNVGTKIKRGDKIGNLGDDKSAETDGERKHLHLGIHKGTNIDYRGYVQSRSELSGWLNFEELKL